MMPMADLFGADINVVPVGNIYPGAGPTIASAGGAMTATTNANVPGDDGGATMITQTPAPNSGRTIMWWVGLVALLLVLVWGAHKAGGPEDFRNIRPTGYNFLTITLTSLLGIVGMKVIFTKWRIAGVSDIVLAA